MVSLISIIFWKCCTQARAQFHYFSPIAWRKYIATRYINRNTESGGKINLWDKTTQRWGSWAKLSKEEKTQPTHMKIYADWSSSNLHRDIVPERNLVRKRKHDQHTWGFTMTGPLTQNQHPRYGRMWDSIQRVQIHCHRSISRKCNHLNRTTHTGWSTTATCISHHTEVDCILKYSNITIWIELHRSYMQYQPPGFTV